MFNISRPWGFSRKGRVLQKLLLLFYIQEGSLAEKQMENLGDSMIYSADISAQIPPILTSSLWNSEICFFGKYCPPSKSSFINICELWFTSPLSKQQQNDKYEYFSLLSYERIIPSWLHCHNADSIFIVSVCW